MTIARIEKPESIMNQNGSNSDEHLQIEMEDLNNKMKRNSEKYKNKDYIWTVQSKEEINPSVFRYTFSNKSGNVNVKKFYEGL